MIIFGICVGDQHKYESVALPTIRAVACTEDVILTEDGRDGIARAYNSILRRAREYACEAVVLMHEDVEILDGNFRSKLLRAISEGASVVGVVGASNISGLNWHRDRTCTGSVFESRGYLDFGPRRADVDVVDGLFLGLAPSAYQHFDFDEVIGARYHGYDVDYCLQARSRGLRVVVTDIDLFHRTKGGFGDVLSFHRAAAEVALKYPEWIHRSLVPTWVRRTWRRVKYKAHRLSGEILAVVQAKRKSGPISPAVGGAIEFRESAVDSSEAHYSDSCLACGASQALSREERLDALVMVCATCGSGRSWPLSDGQVSGRDIVNNMSVNGLRTGRQLRIEEANVRLKWLEHFLPDGVLLVVGCDQGEFVAVAREEGYEAYQVEPSKWAAAKGQMFTEAVSSGTLDQWRSEYPHHRVDFVAMWHVLERVGNPQQLLKEAWEVLKPGGGLVLEVRNFESEAAKRYAAQWNSAQSNAQVTHFTASGLTRLLERTGFDVVDVLQFSNRIYRRPEAWRQYRNQCLIDRVAWPPLDLLRIRAHRPG